MVASLTSSQILFTGNILGTLQGSSNSYSHWHHTDGLKQRELPPHFFDVLHDVLKDHVRMNPNEKLGADGENLRDAVVRDIFQQILHHPNEHHVLNIVTINLGRYVDVVHHQSYPSSLLECMCFRASFGSSLIY